MGPYREDNHGEATRFTQHLAVAEGALEMIEDVPRRIDAGEGFTPVELNQLMRDVRMAWENVWDHLQQARAIAAAKGCELSAFDEARAAAGDIWNDIAWTDRSSLDGATHVRLRVPADSARLAVAALRAGMPEVIVAQPAPLHVDLTTTTTKLINNALAISGGIMMLALIGYLIYEFAL